VVLDDTSPNITYSDGFPTCNNALNSQYFDQTMQYVRTPPPIALMILTLQHSCTFATNAHAEIAFDGLCERVHSVGVADHV
jgi:hypothetical protein